MKQLILNCFLILFSSFLALANSGDSTKPEKAQLGVIVSPDYCYRSLKANADGKWMADIRDTMEIPKVGYSLGVNMAYALSERFTFEIEALFSNKGENTKKYDLGNTPFPYVLSKSAISYKKSYYYLDVPLKLNYAISKGKVKFYLTGGASINTFLGQSTIITTDASNGTETSYIGKSQPKFQKINVAIIAGLGLNYALTDKYLIRVEPVYKRSINSIIDAPIKSYLYTVGINFGLACKF